MIEVLKLNLLNARKATIVNNTLVDLLTILVSDCTKVGKDAGNREPTVEECMKVIKSYIKSCDTNIEIFSKAGNIDKLNKAIYERKVLSEYLPSMMADNDIYRAINDYVATQSGGGSFKGVMEYFKRNYNGLYDGKKLAEVAKKVFS